MPFIPTTIQPLTAAAKVTVKFQGLMLLKPAAGNTCEVGIHRFSSAHAFQITLVIRKPTRPPTLIRLVNGPLTRPLEIKVTPNPGPGVQSFEPTPGPFVRSALTTNNEFDFRWSVNMRTLHPGADFNDGGQPVATLDAGVLYTPTLTRPTLNPELVQGTSPITDRIPLFRFSADLAASISLPGSSKVRLSWFELGERRNFVLPRPLAVDPVDTTYTITLMNDPPIIGAASHEELDLYYRVLEDSRGLIPFEERYSLNVSPSGPTTDEVPCMPVTLQP